MRTNWERFLRWREIWKLNNDIAGFCDVRYSKTKKVALSEMTKYLVESDRENLK